MEGERERESRGALVYTAEADHGQKVGIRKAEGILQGARRLRRSLIITHTHTHAHTHTSS